LCLSELSLQLNRRRFDLLLEKVTSRTTVVKLAKSVEVFMFVLIDTGKGFFFVIFALPVRNFKVRGRVVEDPHLRQKPQAFVSEVVA
jgi:hypothetical protein